MSQLPMKVSEAVERLQQEITLSGPHAEIVVVKIEDLSRLLTSHEALRLAGERIAKNWSSPGDHTALEARREYDRRINFTLGDLRAISLAVEDASK